MNQGYYSKTVWTFKNNDMERNIKLISFEDTLDCQSENILCEETRYSMHGL
jgi:hypothetical protein